tara:strand:- start:32 stop:268 length:237 start_codon:yes stop_codon:yes gene_type:complete
MSIIFCILLSFSLSISAVNVDCIHAIDGDTLNVKHQNEMKVIRLIGVDAPELYAGTFLNKQIKYLKEPSQSLINRGSG